VEICATVGAGGGQIGAPVLEAGVFREGQDGKAEVS